MALSHIVAVCCIIFTAGVSPVLTGTCGGGKPLCNNQACVACISPTVKLDYFCNVCARGFIPQHSIPAYNGVNQCGPSCKKCPVCTKGVSPTTTYLGCDENCFGGQFAFSNRHGK